MFLGFNTFQIVSGILPCFNGGKFPFRHSTKQAKQHTPLQAAGHSF
jgi:hypothetical protein